MTDSGSCFEGRGLDPVLRSVAAYSEHADEYEATHAGKMLDTAERFAASLPPRSMILDAGCGPGRDLARFVALGHTAQGVDLNPDFVAMGNAHARSVQGDLRELVDQFSPGTFDGIWACASLVHFDAPAAADVLGQFAQLIRPGGKLYVCVKATGETGWLDEPDGRRWYTVWEPRVFAATVADVGFELDAVEHDVFVEVWATHAGQKVR